MATRKPSASIVRLLVVCLCLGLIRTGHAEPDSPAPPASAPVIFPLLVSTNDAVLMTNAGYQGLFGRRLIFENDAGSRTFDITSIAPSVLGQLKLNPETILAKVDAAAQKQKEQAARAATQKAAIAYAREWHGAQPQRPDRPPVDLTDPRVCLNELAELASFPMYLNTFEQRAGLGLHFWTQPSDELFTAQWVDFSVRVNHLEQTQLPEIHDLAVQVREIMTDVWRACRMQRDSGFPWRMRSAAHSEFAARNRIVSGFFGSPYSDQDAAIAHENDVKTEQQAQETQETLQSDCRRLILTEDLAFDDLGALWEQKLLPLLTNNAGPAQRTLICASYDQLQDGAGNDLFGEVFAAIAFRNYSGDRLTNLVVRIDQSGSFSEHFCWYGFIPTLGTNDICHPRVMGRTAHIMSRAGTVGFGIVSAWSPGGWQTPFRARTAASGHISDIHVGSDTIEGVFAGGGAVTYDRLSLGFWDTSNPAEMQKMSQLHAEIVAEMDALQPLAIATREELRTNYPVLANPIAARTALLAALQTGRDYQLARFEDPEMKSETVRILTNTAAGLYVLSVTAAWNMPIPGRTDLSKRWRTRYVIGRLMENDLDGCDLAFAPGYTGIAVPDREKMARRETWMITCPEDIHNWVMDQRTDGGLADTFTPAHRESDPFWEAHSTFHTWQQNRYYATTIAAYVMHLDNHGKLCLQCADVLHYDDNTFTDDVFDTTLE